MVTRPGYWFIRWSTTCRINSDPTVDPVAAARQCYGMASKDMQAKFISSRKAEVRKDSLRKKLLEDKIGWDNLAVDVMGRNLPLSELNHEDLKGLPVTAPQPGDNSQS